MNTKSYIHLHVRQLPYLNLPFLVKNWLILPGCWFFPTLLIYIPGFPLVGLTPVDAYFGLFKDYGFLCKEVSLRFYLPSYLNTRFRSLNLILISRGSELVTHIAIVWAYEIV